MSALEVLAPQELPDLGQTASPVEEPFDERLVLAAEIPPRLPVVKEGFAGGAPASRPSPGW